MKRKHSAESEEMEQEKQYVEIEVITVFSRVWMVF